MSSQSIWKTKLLNAKFVISVLKQNKNFTDMLNCYICNFHTFSKQSFRTHKILFHTGQLRQFNCSLCPFHSSFEGSVKNHEKNVHKKPYFDVWQNVEIIVEWLSRHWDRYLMIHIRDHSQRWSRSCQYWDMIAWTILELGRCFLLVRTQWHQQSTIWWVTVIWSLAVGAPVSAGH